MYHCSEQFVAIIIDAYKNIDLGFGNAMKAIFLDRDGTINIDKNYLYRIEDYEYLDGAKEALRLFQNAGYMLIIITNQSGIARGFFSEEEYKKLEYWLSEDLEKSGIHITATYYCPHLPGSMNKHYDVDCCCRKPKLGMFEKAIKEYEIDLEGSIAIGDKRRDVSICDSDIGKGMLGFLLYAEDSCQDGNIISIKGGLLEVAKRIVGCEYAKVD